MQRIWSLFKEDFINFIKKHDITVLVETHFKKDDCMPNVTGFKFYGKTRKSEERGGVGVLIRCSFLIDVISTSIDDILALKVTHELSTKQFILVCVYFPPLAPHAVTR